MSGSFCACSGVCGGNGKKNACTCKIHPVSGSDLGLRSFIHHLRKKDLYTFSSCSEHTSMLINTSLSVHSWGRRVPSLD